MMSLLMYTNDSMKYQNAGIAKYMNIDYRLSKFVIVVT